ncbi:MAG: pyridoxamine 5'-phosphate oxidase family protein [Burkholderiales bacterium]|nr:pyridoxamine 5'-phosphate oxidase family protein [Burkholderiales bacterium]
MIDGVNELRARYPEARARALAKELDRLDPHCRRFIELSPFLVLATVGTDGRVDASPRGGEPGFVRVVDDRTLWMPDASGNNRLDSFTNVAQTGRCGLLFMLPGMDETLRVNGTAKLLDTAEVLAQFPREKNPPRAVLAVSIEEAYLHCAKALMRSKLWSADHRIERSMFPSMGQMIRDQTGSTEPAETQEQMLARYAVEL